MTASVARKIAEETATTYQNLIGGKWQAASDGRTVDMVSPSDGQAFARIARGSKGDVDAAVKAARHAFEEGAWSKLTAVDRGRLMTKLADGQVLQLIAAFLKADITEDTTHWTPEQGAPQGAVLTCRPRAGTPARRAP